MQKSDKSLNTESIAQKEADKTDPIRLCLKPGSEIFLLQ